MYRRRRPAPIIPRHSPSHRLLRACTCAEVIRQEHLYRPYRLQSRLIRRSLCTMEARASSGTHTSAASPLPVPQDGSDHFRNSSAASSFTSSSTLSDSSSSSVWSNSASSDATICLRGCNSPQRKSRRNSIAFVRHPSTRRWTWNRPRATETTSSIHTIISDDDDEVEDITACRLRTLNRSDRRQSFGSLVQSRSQRCGAIGRYRNGGDIDSNSGNSDPLFHLIVSPDSETRRGIVTVVSRDRSRRSLGDSGSTRSHPITIGNETLRETPPSRRRMRLHRNRPIPNASEEPIIDLVARDRSPLRGECLDAAVIGARNSDEDCVICLSEQVNRSILLPCMHTYCLRCITTWVLVNPTCPLCKGSAERIIHSVISDSDYSEVVVSMFRRLNQRGISHWDHDYQGDGNSLFSQFSGLRRNIWLQRQTSNFSAARSRLTSYSSSLSDVSSLGSQDQHQLLVAALVNLALPEDGLGSTPPPMVLRQLVYINSLHSVVLPTSNDRSNYSCNLRPSFLAANEALLPRLVAFARRDLQALAPWLAYVNSPHQSVPTASLRHGPLGVSVDLPYLDFLTVSVVQLMCRIPITDSSDFLPALRVLLPCCLSDATLEHFRWELEHFARFSGTLDQFDESVCLFRRCLLQTRQSNFSELLPELAVYTGPKALDPPRSTGSFTPPPVLFKSFIVSWIFSRLFPHMDESLTPLDLGNRTLTSDHNMSLESLRRVNERASFVFEAASGLRYSMHSHGQPTGGCSWDICEQPSAGVCSLLSHFLPFSMELLARHRGASVCTLRQLVNQSLLREIIDLARVAEIRSGHSQQLPPAPANLLTDIDNAYQIMLSRLRGLVFLFSSAPIVGGSELDLRRVLDCNLLPQISQPEVPIVSPRFGFSGFPLNLEQISPRDSNSVINLVDHQDESESHLIGFLQEAVSNDDDGADDNTNGTIIPGSSRELSDTVTNPSMTTNELMDVDSLEDSRTLRFPSEPIVVSDSENDDDPHPSTRPAPRIPRSASRKCCSNHRTHCCCCVKRLFTSAHNSRLSRPVSQDCWSAALRSFFNVLFSEGMTMSEHCNIIPSLAESQIRNQPIFRELHTSIVTPIVISDDDDDDQSVNEEIANDSSPKMNDYASGSGSSTDAVISTSTNFLSDIGNSADFKVDLPNTPIVRPSTAEEFYAALNQFVGHDRTDTEQSTPSQVPAVSDWHCQSSKNLEKTSRQRRNSAKMLGLIYVEMGTRRASSAPPGCE